MLPPLPRCSGWVSSSLISPRRVRLPRKGRRVGPHIVLFEACSAFTRVAACTLALSPIRDTLIEGFSHFVTSMTAPIASGWSESPGGPCTHWKAPPFHGARRNRSLRRLRHAVAQSVQTRNPVSETAEEGWRMSDKSGACQVITHHRGVISVLPLCVLLMLTASPESARAG